MGREKQSAQQAKDLLTLCLAKAIQESLCARLGPSWFYLFLQDDRAQDPKFQIARNGQTSIRDMDLQALLKILRYRDSYADHVFAYYGFDTGDAFTDQTKKRQIRSLLDRLITDYRNSIEAHSRVADIEDEPDRIYGYREALQDMLKLSGIFKLVCDVRGVSYHSQIEELCKPKRTALWLSLAGAVVLVIGIVLAIVLLSGGEAPEEPTEPPTTGNVFYNPNNVVFDDDDLGIRPMHVYYDGDTLVAKCFVLNGFDKTIHSIHVDKLVITDDRTGQVLAQASFGELEGLSLAPQSYGEWTFVFPAETVLEEDGNLESLLFEFSYRYK